MFSAQAYRVTIIRTVCLAITLALSLLSPASALQSQTKAIPDLSAFALPDGSLPVICFGDGSPESGGDEHCDECLQAAVCGIALPDLGALVFRSRDGLHRTLKRRTLLRDLRTDDANSARAPPVS